MGVAHTQMNLYIAPFKKALRECLLCYRCYLLTQIIYRCLCERLLCKSFLNCDCASNAIYRTKKAPIQVLLGFGSALLTQRFFVRLCKRLLCQTLLDCDCTSDLFIRTRKGTQRVPFVLLVLFAYANNLSLLVQTITSLNPLGLRLRKRPIYTHQKRHSKSAFCVTGAICLRK